MYEKDKHQRITLRLNEKQFSFVSKSAQMLGVTPSDYLRMIINSAMYMAENDKSLKDASDSVIQTAIVGVLGRENDETDIDN